MNMKDDIMNKKIFAVVVIFFVLLISFNGCIENNSDFIYVDIDGGLDFVSIQEAINSCSDGDTIIVNEGIYYELLIINKSITLMGKNTKSTIISCDNKSLVDIVQIVVDSCIFKGFTINGPSISSEVTGIELNTSNNVISGNIIKNTKNGIYLAESSNNNRIYNNVIENNKYGISTRKANDNNISDNDISNNDIYGIYLSLSNNYIISENEISYCSTGIRIKGSDDSVVFNNTISYNDAGLLCCCGSGDNKIYCNTFEENKNYNGRDDIYNQWDNGEKGNYWDDYIEKYPNATSNNGIWDTAYQIQSPYSNESKYDRYPLVGPIKN